MENTLIEKNNLSVDTETGIIDLDSIAEKMDALTGEIAVYRASIVRHLQARAELLGKPVFRDDSSQSIKQLLELRDALDSEFRERFRITDPGFNRRDDNSAKFIEAGDYLCGR